MKSAKLCTTRSDHDNFKSTRIHDITGKKEKLIALENLLKKRINEFKELCLREGELTGHLPFDYPLQPREPIPQIRRRTHNSNNNLYENNSIAPPSLTRSRQFRYNDVHNNHQVQPQAAAFAINHNANHLPFPSRPTSTNSTSSSNSTASSNTRSVANVIPMNHFQPYYEETKPFQMSDFYKYSAKHRQKANNNDCVDSSTLTTRQVAKTTRQHQEDVMKKNTLKFSSCDDQIQASVKLLEKSGQKLIEATAKAIAGNPGLAEKLNNIMPSNGDRY